MSKTIEQKGFLQNILKMEARCKTYGINKVFVSKILHTLNASSDIFSKLNLDIENVYKSNSFHFIGNNNISMIFLLRDCLHLLHSGKELLANNFYLNLNNILRKRTYHPNIHLNWKEVVRKRKKIVICDGTFSKFSKKNQKLFDGLSKH